jgi:hypothetical protein
VVGVDHNTLKSWVKLTGMISADERQRGPADGYRPNETTLYASSTQGPDKVDSMARCVCCTQSAPSYYTLKIVPKNPNKDFFASRPYVLKIDRLP